MSIAAVKSQVSYVSLRLMILCAFRVASCERITCSQRATRNSQPPHQFLEVLPPMLEVPVLIEAGAGRREEHGLAGLGVLRRPIDGPPHVMQRDDLRRPI